jgi:glycosyltransferase involved in cell wall biosynthesis
MNIGINALFNATGGSLTNLRILLEEWSKDPVTQNTKIFLYSTRQTWEKIKDLRLQRIQVRFAPDGWSCFGRRLFFEQLWLPFVGKRDDLDVLFCPANTTPCFFHAPVIVTFQNIAPFEPGIPWWEMGLRRTFRFKILKYFMFLSAWRAQKVLFGSQYFRDLFCKSTGLLQMKTAVIPRSTPSRTKDSDLRLDRLAQAKGYPLKQPFLLCVSHLHPYKKLIELIEAFAEAKKSPYLDEVQLVIAGKAYLSSQYGNRVRQRIIDLSLAESAVAMVGELSESEIEVLLNHADAFIFSSVCENCPTSLVEAMQHGLPLLCSDKSSMPEVAGEAAAYFDPTNVKQITSVLYSIYKKPNLLQELSDKSKKRARELPDVQMMAKATWDQITGCTRTIKETKLPGSQKIS